MKSETNEKTPSPPRVCVLIPTYNRPDALARAIESVLQQEYENWTLYVINDGGRDVSHVVESFRDPRLHYIAAPRKGKSAALNLGIRSSDSELIGYLDDDDIHYPNHLRLLVGALDENPDAVMAYSDTYEVRLKKKGEIWREVARRVENQEDVTFEMMLNENYVNHKNILHHRAALERTGLYDEELEVLIDWDIAVRLFAAGPVVHVRETTGEHFLYTDEAGRAINSITSASHLDRERFFANRRRIIANMASLPRIALGAQPSQSADTTEEKRAREISRLVRMRLFRALDEGREEIVRLKEVCDQQWKALERFRSNPLYRIFRAAKSLGTGLQRR
ncbi:MAG: glycosyltransferase [Armatimonadetes bacterium]|nr:glycosyltransferase [Armatimonadota bacterium]NIO56305.1 glycosyltransferase [Candidatus Latescibacterota bacterium]NIM22722.1 glycosyltransferase [Armatimonadota bacterium]NIM66552.1 glycosyltransferase [Armatimonadota bacterium]NIM75091.1 glycosyltransferase [Armatimonadota bacterium]